MTEPIHVGIDLPGARTARRVSLRLRPTVR